MTAIIEEIISSIELDIQLHSAWIGNIYSGLEAEKMLRGKQPFTFALRKGESHNDYYITFVDRDQTVRHQPFVITITAAGWHYENGAAGGPFTNATIDDVLHLIMHCRKEECVPFIIR